LDQTIWVEKQAKKWTNAVGDLAFVAENYPQAAYAGLQKSLQAEWQFVQRVTEGVDVEFSEIEHALHAQFLPALFGKLEITNSRRQLTCLPVKKAGLAIPNPTESAGGNWWTASTVACGHLISVLRGKEEFRLVMHQSIMAEEKGATRKMNSDATKAKMETILHRLPKGLNHSI
jgi:hypothetical protein